MTGGEIVALIAALTGLLAAVLGGIRNMRSDKMKNDVDKAAQILSGYNGFVERLEGENKRLTERMDVMRAQHAEELRERDERIDELGTQLWALQTRPTTRRERSTDR